MDNLLKYLDIREPIEDQTERLNDLVRFPAYAAEAPSDPKFALTGEEAEQNSLLDLLLLAIRRICELINESIEREEVREKWNEGTRHDYWHQFLGTGSVEEHYWKGELRDWLMNLDDGDYEYIRKDVKVNKVCLYDMGFWNLLSEVLSHLAVTRIKDWASYYHFIPENPNAAEWFIFWLRAIKSTNSLRDSRRYELYDS